MNTIPFKKLTKTAILPTRGTEDSVGLDIYSDNEKTVVIRPGESYKIPTGFSVALPPMMAGLIFPRSGLATKEGLRLANCVAVIDPDYRGEWFIPIYNDSDDFRIIEPNQRIAQLLVVPVYMFEPKFVSELTETNRGVGGFGSTGK